jgi:hypothetical protein
MTKTPPPDSPEIDGFTAELVRQRRSAHTIRAYTQDLTGFARWFLDTTGKQAFTPNPWIPS